MNPIISIIVLTYNNFEKIEDTFYSILNQNFNDYEVIVSDDGSRTFDEESIGKFSEMAEMKHISFTCRKSHVNEGTVKNINQALKLVRGDYVAFLCPGDFYADSNVLKDFVNRLRSKQSLIVTGKMNYVDCLYKERAVIKPNEKQCRILMSKNKWEILGRIANGHFIPAPSTFYNKKIYEILGVYDEKYRLIEDYPFLYNALLNDMTIDFFDRIAVCYRSDGISSIPVKPKPFDKDLEEVRKNLILPTAGSFQIFDRRLFLFQYGRKQWGKSCKRFIHYIFNFDLCIYLIGIKLTDIIKARRSSENKDISKYRWWERGEV